MSSEYTSSEGIYIKLNFHKKNWLLCCTYNPNRNFIMNHSDIIKRSLDSYSTKFLNLMVIRDLNAEVNLECMKLFCETYDLSSLIKVPTCYKNPEQPSCIDLLLTNRPKTFQSSSIRWQWQLWRRLLKNLSQGSVILGMERILQWKV